MSKITRLSPHDRGCRFPSLTASPLRIPFALCVKDSESKGYLRDISENGIRVAGISAEPGSTLTFLAPLNKMGNAQQVEFSAVCRWAKVKGIRRKYLVSGFEISKISNDDRERFLELLQWFHFENPDDDFIADTSLTTDQFFYGDTVAQAGGRHFSGTIHEADLLDVVQFMLLNNQKTLLDVKSIGGGQGALYLSEGKVVHAIQGDLTGYQAFMACMNFQGGEFATRPWSEPNQRTMSEAGDFLLMEAARLRDELSARL